MSLLGEEDVSVQHRAAAVVAGRDVETDDGAAVPMVASVQPIAGKFVEILAEGARRGASFMMIVENAPDLRVTDLVLKRASDIVTRANGDRFRTVTVHDWSIHKRGLPHRVATLEEIGQDA